MSAVFFYSHNEKTYKNNKWRCIFSQWYQDKGFIAKKPLSKGKYLSKDIWDCCVKNQFFMIREQWMMYIKALLFANDQNENLMIASQILENSNPAIIKKLGRKVQDFDQEIWNEHKYQIVLDGNYFEFSQNSKMKRILLETKNKELIEASPYDSVWGIGFKEIDAVGNESEWGENLLGKAIMETRSHLQ